jgi:magnesium transporter
VLQAYVVEGGTLKPVSGDVAALGHAYWIDIYDPTPDEQKAVERALGIRIRVPEEPTRFQISAPLRSADGTIVLTALLLTNLDIHQPRLVTVQFIRGKGPLVTVSTGGRDGLAWLAQQCESCVPADTSDAFSVLLDLIIECATDLLDHLGGDLDRLNNALFQTMPRRNAGCGSGHRHGAAIANSSGYSPSSAIAARCWSSCGEAC